ncbi:ABC transporter permease [Okibacterium endophyticum]
MTGALQATTQNPSLFTRQSTRRRAETILTVLLLLVIAVTIIGPFVPIDAARTVAAGYAPRGEGLVLGSDGLGRDVVARLLHGGAGLLAVAAISTVTAVLVGVVTGMVLSIFRGIGRILGRALDVLLVTPSLLTMLILIFGLGGGVGTMIVITTTVSAPFIARYTRSLVTPLLGSPFVLAARTAGDSWPRIAALEILPNITGPIAADAGARFVAALYLVAAAGFLGFNPLGSDSDWAGMIQSGLDGLALNPWASLAPTIAIALVTVPANLLADRIVRRTNR